MSNDGAENGAGVETLRLRTARGMNKESTEKSQGRGNMPLGEHFFLVCREFSPVGPPAKGHIVHERQDHAHTFYLHMQWRALYFV